MNAKRTSGICGVSPAFISSARRGGWSAEQCAQRSGLPVSAFASAGFRREQEPSAVEASKPVMPIKAGRGYEAHSLVKVVNEMKAKGRTMTRIAEALGYESYGTLDKAYKRALRMVSS